MLRWRRYSSPRVCWVLLAVVLLISGPTRKVLAQDEAAKAPQTSEGASAATTPQPRLSQKDATSESDSGSLLRLGVGDLVEVGVYNVPELASKTRIDSHGDVYLPLIDYVHVAGLTTDEAQGLIEKRLSDGGFVKNPHVTIFVDEYASQGASVLGEVAKPGVYPVLGQQRLFDLISAAGGFTDKAGRSITVTHRSQPDKPNTVTLAKTLADSGDANIDVLPGDTVIVHRADIVYVVGDVARPSGFLIDRGSLTVLQAIALAGGTTRTSKLNGTRIIHRGPSGMTETRVPLKKILQAKVSDMPMKADDILFVPSSAFKSALRDNASIAMQATSLGLVAVR
jgi:polysaccharide biosynthesis/export protein